MSTESTKRRSKLSASHQVYKVTYLPTGLVTDQSRTETIGEVSDATAAWSRPYPPYIRNNTHMFVRKAEDGLGRGSTSRTVGYYQTECVGHARWLATHPPTGVAKPFTRTVTRETAEDTSIVAYAKARGKLHGDTIDLGETVGGARQTVDMFRLAVLRIDKMITMAASKDWTGLAQYLKVPRDFPSLRRAASSKEFANAWLELQFGWKPLLDDVYNASQAAGKRLQAGQQIRKVSGYLPKGEPSPNLDVFGGKAGVTGTVTSPWAADLNAFGLSNPSLTAWQILPLSFVVDWFLPVSHYLAGLTASAGLSAMVGWRVSVHGFESGWTPYGVYERVRNITRTPMVGLAPIPTGTFSVPMRDSMSKLTTAIALARQRMDGAPVKFKTGRWPR